VHWDEIDERSDDWEGYDGGCSEAPEEPFDSICIYGIQPICQVTEGSIDEALDDVASNTEMSISITVETRINGTRRRTKGMVRNTGLCCRKIDDGQ